MLHFAPAIPDMDGFVAKTAAGHSLACKKMFDACLPFQKAAHHEPFREFTRTGYLAFGNRKNDLFNQVVKENGVEVYGSTIKLIKELLDKGVKTGIADSSKNCGLILEQAGVINLGKTHVGGVVAVELGSQDTPEPDIFTRTCDDLRVAYQRTVIVEEVNSEVQAGTRGKSGFVLGAAKEGNAQELVVNGAKVVVSDLAEIAAEDIDGWVNKKTFLKKKQF